MSEQQPTQVYLQRLVEEELRYPGRNPGLRDFVDQWRRVLRLPAVDWPPLPRR